MLQTAYAFSGPILLAAALAAAGHVVDGGRRPSMRPVQVNSGTAQRCELLALEGAGNALVERIALVRTVLDLSDPGSLRWVPGIGGRRLHQWWPWLVPDGG